MPPCLHPWKSSSSPEGLYIQPRLADVEEQAQEMFDRLMQQRAEREGITEKLKADNQMVWGGRMNNLRSAVTETVNAEVIFL